MTLRKQLQWGGLLIIVSAFLMNSTNVIIFMNSKWHNLLLQSLYMIGYIGLILSLTIIHIAQARRSGIIGLLGYLITVFCISYTIVDSFLVTAEFSGIQEARTASIGIWKPFLQYVVFGIFAGAIPFTITMALSGMFPKWAGILTALGVAVQLPTQYAMAFAGPLFFIFTIGGSILFGAGLIWMGWALWSGKGMSDEEPRLSNLDRGWGAPFIILTSILLIANAYINTFAELSLLGGILNLIGYSALMFSIVILHTAHADRAGGLGLAGFLSTHLGATLSMIPAYLIMAQLAGQIESNRALMASWVDIPIGRYGNYMVIFGILLFGIAAIRANVFPRWSGWLIVIGSAISLPTNFQSQAYLFIIFWAIGATLQGIGLGWMGWSLFKKNPLVK